MFWLLKQPRLLFDCFQTAAYAQRIEVSSTCTIINSISVRTCWLSPLHHIREKDVPKVRSKLVGWI
jgi:hypothetical protein